MEVELPKRPVKLPIVWRAQPRTDVDLLGGGEVNGPVFDESAYGRPVGRMHTVEKLSVTL